MAEQAFMAGIVVRTKVSGVKSRWLGCCELRVCPGLCTLIFLQKFAGTGQPIEQMQTAFQRLRHVVRVDGLGGVVADATGTAEKDDSCRQTLCQDHGVVSSAADHTMRRTSCLPDRLLDLIDDKWIHRDCFLVE